MKNKILIFMRIISFAIILTVIMLSLSNYLSSTKLEDYPKRNSFLQNLNAEEKDTIDVLFAGDSSVMGAVTPMKIWNDKKITSYDLSYAMMEPQEMYYDIQEVLAKQNLNVVFIETQCLVEIVNDEPYLVNKTKNIVDYFDKELIGNINKYLPVMKYKDEIQSRSINDFFYDHPDEINDAFKGYYYKKDIVPFTGEHNKDVEGVACFKNGGDIFLKKLILLCKENNCKVVMMTLPQGTEWNKKSHNIIYDFAKENNLDYIDFDVYLEKLLPDFSWADDTRDGGGHLNYNGAVKVTNWLEQYITDNLKLGPSDLNENQKKKWNQDMNLYNSIVK